MDEHRKMLFVEHLEELRKRLMICLVAVGVGFAISYMFKERLFRILAQPLLAVMPPGEGIIFTGVAEAFFCYLKVAFLSGVLMAAPVIMYEMWLFVAPGLHQHERRFILPLVVISCFFFACGVLFGYLVIFPFAFKYLLSFGSQAISPLPSMREYLSLTTTLLLAFGFSFQLPLVLTALARIGLLSADFLRRKRKYAVVLIFVVAAIVTPTPDAFNQLLMAGPLWILYEMGIWGALAFGKKSRKEMRVEAAGDASNT